MASNLTIDVNWEIADMSGNPKAGESGLKSEDMEGGNAGFRFDTAVQTDTLGPYPPNAATGPEPTNGEPGIPPSSI